jgi:hypothetical protein
MSQDEQVAIIKCFECGHNKDIQHHHVVPKSRGGKTTLPLCSSCHSLVHNKKMTSVSFLTKQALGLRKANRQRAGQIPFGYRLSEDRKTLIPDHAMSQPIESVRALRESGHTIRKIVEIMNASQGLSAEPRKWHISTVQKAIAFYS